MKIKDVWVKSTAAEKDGYLSFLLNEWARFPERIAQQLPHLPFVDWNAQRKGVPTLWMEMFLIPRCVFDLSTPRGQTAWCGWWAHRQQTSEQAFQSFGAVNSLHPQKDLKDRSSSLQRSGVVIDMLPHILSPQCTTPIVNSFSQALIAVCEQHNHVLSAEWNALSGIVAEALTPFVLHDENIDANVRQWWDKQSGVMHPSRMRLPLSQHEIGLVGRPEYIFSYMIKEIIMGAFNKTPPTHNPQQRIEKLDEAFWASCKSRWDCMGGKVNGDFFLPSMHLMIAHTHKEITKVCPPQQALEYTSRLEKLALLAATSSWPWETEKNAPTVRRKM